jgi:DNA-binding transcriptional MerR regulator
VELSFFMLETKKTYYSISEVCAMTELEPHVLRYWETEFAQLRPKKNSAGNRAYREKDISIICFIKRLLYEEQYTIPGAKKKISEMKDEVQQLQLPLQVPPAPAPASGQMQQIKIELQQLLNFLKQ